MNKNGGLKRMPAVTLRSSCVKFGSNLNRLNENVLCCFMWYIYTRYMQIALLSGMYQKAKGLFHWHELFFCSCILTQKKNQQPCDGNAPLRHLYCVLDFEEMKNVLEMGTDENGAANTGSCQLL